MITVDTTHQFDWLTVPPEAWPVTVDFDYDRSKYARYRWWVA